MLILTTARNERWLPDQCCRGKFLVSISMPASKYIIFCWLYPVCLSFLFQNLCLARVQHLSANEKDQVQDFCNWVSSGSEEASRSATDSPVIGLIENPTASCPNADTAEKPNEPSPKTSDTPAAAEGASKAGGSGSCEAEGSKGPSVRLVPFQSMPQSA